MYKPSCHNAQDKEVLMLAGQQYQLRIIPWPTNFIETSNNESFTVKHIKE
jgi:hypothetical protein